MALTSGTKLGPYEILAPLGAGGMGEVYRARDTRLGREVAVKVLPQHLSSNPDLKARFEREAKAISALNHPHICTLHDVGHQDGIDFLVMELMEGETLADRLQRGPLPLKQALEAGIEIAEALEKAHKNSIVHRDLKPGNIMLTKTGAKLMDFGLAKPAQSMAAMASGSIDTMSKPLTSEGKIVGTYQYMAPEQIHGQNADARTDIFALGAVLYEMVTGKRAFAGKSQISVMSAILEKEPEPLSAVQPLTPPTLDHVITRALAKDPEERWQSAADLRGELRWVAESGRSVQPPSPAAAGFNTARTILWIAAVALAVISAVLYWRETTPQSGSIRALILPPEGKTFNFLNDQGAPPALSPDRKRLVFGSSGMLCLRSLDASSAQPLRGTENARFPFWCPDSHSIGFFADDKLKTIDAGGGPVSVLCDAPDPRGGSWGKDFIVFAPSIRTPIYRIGIAGGNPEAVTKIDSSQHSTHRWPWFLPDGKHFVYLAALHGNAKGAQNGIYLGSVDGGEGRHLFSNASNAMYGSGYLLYLNDSSLLARPFNAARGEVTGEAHVVSEDVADDFNIWRAVVTASENGLIAFQTGNAYAPSQLTWFDRSGRILGKLGEKAFFYGPRLSPDGRHLGVAAGPQPAQDLWVVDVERGIKTRFTFGGGNSQGPIWSPRGDRLAFSGLRDGRRTQVLLRAANGLSPESKVVDPPSVVTDWSPDGKYLLYTLGELSSNEDQVWAMPLFTGAAPFRVAPAGVFEREAQFSPDGRWMAYVSRESGRDEIYVASFPGPGEKVQVSNDGGWSPRWRGQEIFYESLSNEPQLMVAKVSVGPHSFSVGSVRPLFTLSVPVSPVVTVPEYDVSRDAQRIIVNYVPQANTSSNSLTLLSNWPATLKK